jgi:exodeoxyribonuclease VII small subunit
MTDQVTADTAPAGLTTPATDPSAERRRVAALPFDRALAEFKAVVEKLETGNLPLEESIALFEQGVLLQTRCERLLNEAELRFQRLVDATGGQMRTVDLSLGEAEEPG